jgi:phthiodiolone/phenolphthiodiolone dimycocerosates ketoreductase
MSGFRVGIMDPAIASRPRVDSFTRASYLSAVACGVDSFWVPDHLNALFPRTLWQPKFAAGAKVCPRRTPTWSRGPCWVTSRLAIGWPA